MAYDRGYGPRDGWKHRMRGGAHGYDQGYRAEAEWDGERPWVGGYRTGYQGGSGGYSINTGPRYLDGGPLHDRDHHERGFRRPRGQSARGGGLSASRGGASGFGGSSPAGYDRGFSGSSSAGYDRGFGGSRAPRYDRGFRGAAGSYDGGFRTGGGYGREFSAGPRGYDRGFGASGGPGFGRVGGRGPGDGHPQPRRGWQG